MSNAEFAGLLARSRKRAGISQQELADLSTLSCRAIRNLEKGKVRRPRPETVRPTPISRQSGSSAYLPGCPRLGRRNPNCPNLFR